MSGGQQGGAVFRWFRGCPLLSASANIAFPDGNFQGKRGEARRSRLGVFGVRTRGGGARRRRERPRGRLTRHGVVRRLPGNRAWAILPRVGRSGSRTGLRLGIGFGLSPGCRPPAGGEKVRLEPFDGPDVQDPDTGRKRRRLAFWCAVRLPGRLVRAGAGPEVLRAKLEPKPLARASPKAFRDSCGEPPFVLPAVPNERRSLSRTRSRRAGSCCPSNSGSCRSAPRP